MDKKFLIRDNHPFDPTAEYPSNLIWVMIASPNSNPNMSKNREISSQWLDSDTEENYIRTTEMGVVHTYKADDFYYDLNKHGFRCDNFDTMKQDSKSVIYLGCSHTLGIGLPEEDVWSHKVHKQIEEKDATHYNYINLGSSGNGVDSYMHLMPYFKKFKPSYVISLTPDITRMIMPLEDGYLSKMGSWMLDNPTIMEDFPDNRLKTAYRNLLLSGDNFFEYRKNVIYNNISSLGEILNYKFIEMTHTWDFEDKNEEHNEQGLQKLMKESRHENARDNGHYNRTYHTVLAEKIMNKLKEDK
jgi:hypothetical protein